MKCINDKISLHQVLASYWRAGQTIALVPTMGNLHAGHLSLVREAKACCDKVVVSIFVNPAQFAPHEDYDIYPRTLEADCKALAELGCVDIVFAPSVSSIYPLGKAESVQIHLPVLEHTLCGVSRPHFFVGVATVVTKLFNLIRPQVAVFGEKDFQQLVIIRRLVESLHLPVKIVGMPVVREVDGLAMSSRNQYLNAEERALAPQFYTVLRVVMDQLRAKGDGLTVSAINKIIECAKKTLVGMGFVVDYLEVRRAKDLAILESAEGCLQPMETLTVLGAVWVGTTRLIDNGTVP